MAIPVAAHSRGAARAIVAALALGFSVGALATSSLEAMQVGSTHLQLGSASYDLSSGASNSSVDTRAVGMASADFNSDGYADLISGYAQGEGGLIAVHLGNPEAYSPTSPAAFARIERGIYPPGFAIEPQVLNLPVVPELLIAGDFDADGKPDVVFAQRGDDAIYFLPRSKSGFGAARKIALSGTVDAIAAGEIDFPNASLDLVVAISADSGASLKIFRDGIANDPSDYPVAAAVTQLAVGNLDDRVMGAVAILAGGKVSILHGYNQQEGVPGFNRLEALDFGGEIQAFVLGNFIWDREGRTKLALLQADGSVAIAVRGALNTHPFSLTEVREKRRAQIAAQSVMLKHWQPGDGGAWAVNETLAGVVSKGLAVRGATLVRANLAGQETDDLIVVDSLNQTLKVLTMEGAQRKRYSVNSTSEPVAVLAIPTSSFALPSLIVLGKGAVAASILPSATSATFNVSKTADTNDGVCNADCSLREAIGAANVSAGADTVIVPAGTYQLTIGNSGNVNEDNNAQGDLDVNDAVTIIGAGSATTIVRAGTTTSNGIDKVIAFNPLCISPMATAISGVTISFGRNTQPAGAPDFSYTGGGMDWCGTGNSSMTVTNSVFDSNTNTQGYGGGINLDSFAANGSVAITGTTISANKVLAGNNTGGGVNLFADQHSVTITNSTITGNVSPGEGGGLFVRHTNGGAILVQGSTISNNTAASRGGGVSSFNFGVATFTINQDSVVSGNISQGLPGLAAEGGGIYSNSAATTTINEVTITGNSANGAGVSEQRGGGGIATGGGIVNVTFNRIVGNSALGLGGSGIHKDLNAGATNATNNWWGCNAGAASAPCDRAVVAAGAGTLVSTPHLVLNHAASPNTIVVGQTSALTADFLTNSGSAAIAVANLDAMIGTTHAHNNPVRGTLSATQSAIQSSGSATATFTATAAGAGSADSVVDSQTRTVAITVNKANTVTTITSDNPDSSVSGGVVAVNYTVAVSAPGAGTPTGNVVITISGGGETCTGTVAAGTCNLTLTAVGSRTITAAYAGDANFSASSDTEPHTVVNPTSVTIAVAPASVSEDGAANLVYTVTRDASLVSATVVNITTSGTATSGTDYAGGVTSVTIPANGTTATITIDPTADNTIEADETVILTVATGAGYIVGTPASATGTIVDNDTANVSAAGAVNPEGNANNTMQFNLQLDVATPGGFNINYQTRDDTAIAGSDYVAASGSVSFTGTAGESHSISIGIIGDVVPEADERFFVDLTSSNPVVMVTPATVTGDIFNDDLIADLQLSLQRLPGEILPGGPISYQVQVQNLSSVVPVPAAAFQFTASVRHTSISWTCAGSAGSSCPASGNGVPAHSISLGKNGNVIYMINAIVDSGIGAGEMLTGAASINVSAPYSDPVSANNSATVETPLSTDIIFRDGFETP
ncbi:MAG: Ig-like domain repeat protein [Xanthomonadales bacterium]|nr:Ig-like domain repeat protein [Xanthomonadales bacterium]